MIAEVGTAKVNVEVRARLLASRHALHFSFNKFMKNEGGAPHFLLCLVCSYGKTKKNYYSHVNTIM